MKAISGFIIQDFLKLYGCNSSFEYLSGGHEWSDGTIYQARHDGKDILLKISPVSLTDQYARQRTMERLRYMAYLSEHGMNTTSPLYSSSGELVQSLECESDTYICYAWYKIQGEHIQISKPTERRSFYFQWGQTVGRMHSLARAYPQWRHSEAVDQQGQPLISRRQEWQHFYHWLQDEEVKAAWIVMQQRLDALPVNRENFGFIHNDPHPHNILLEDSKLVLIDFDVANFHWFILELAICLYSEYSRVVYHSNEKAFLPQLNELFILPFMEGYESQNILPKAEYAQIELFLNYRRFIMFAVFYDQIKNAAPHVLDKMKMDMISFNTYLPRKTFFSDFL